MIRPETYEEEHIRELQAKSHKDPQLIERALYAMGLLEALTQTGLKFIFKGGSSLMLLLEHPMRLSTDIDIVVEPGTDIIAHIKEASKILPFTDYNEQTRIGKNNIEKRHFQFTYNSPVLGEEFYILLLCLLHLLLRAGERPTVMNIPDMWEPPGLSPRISMQRITVRKSPLTEPRISYIWRHVFLQRLRMNE